MLDVALQSGPEGGSRLYAARGDGALGFSSPEPSLGTVSGRLLSVVDCTTDGRVDLLTTAGLWVAQP